MSCGRIVALAFLPTLRYGVARRSAEREGGRPASGSPKRAALHDVGVAGVVGDERDAANRAGQHERPAETQLEAEAHVDVPKLEEAAAERPAGEPNARELRKELSAAHEHFGGVGRQHDDFVKAVARTHRDPTEGGER